MPRARVREPFWAQANLRRAQGLQASARRRARRLGAGGFAAAVALPALLFYRPVADIASEFRVDVHYFLAEWSPWLLILAGLAFLAPVAWSAGRDPDSRWYPRARNAYAGWGITLYLLGLALGTQVAQLHGLSS
jgi:hypothetical protein